VNTGQNNPKLIIRAASLDDSPSIALVLYESFIEYKTSYTPEAFAATAVTSDQVQIRMSQGPIWVALYDEEVVGAVSVVPDDDALYIRGMAVIPNVRGRQIGESLLKQVERYAVAQDCRRLVLSTTPFLGSAIRLYDRLGFRRVSDETHHLFGTPLFTMEKILGQPE
jgi:ribosomal protein S18 acetylase RimI-like enzyme